MQSATALREPQMPAPPAPWRPVSTPLVKAGLLKRGQLLQAHPQALRARPAVTAAPELPTVLELLELLELLGLLGLLGLLELRVSREGMSSG